MNSHPSAPDGPAIPDDNAPLIPARRPTRWTVRRGRSIAFVLIALALAVSLLAVYETNQAAEGSSAQAAAVDERLSVLELDLEQRRQQRDQERDQLDERIDQVVCDILGEFPAGDARADRLRQRYDCPVPQPTEDTP